jgi:protein-tyrosine phosphatase
MLAAAAASGTAVIAATPHVRSDFPDVHVDQLARRCSELRAAASHARIEVEIVQAGELSLIWALEASDHELSIVSYGQRGTDLLIETPAMGAVGLEMPLWQLRQRGYRITLAHPERNPLFQQSPQALEGLVQQGILLAVNADSLLSRRGSSWARLARHLCVEGLAHALASDGHRADSWRPVTALAQGANAAAELVGADRARWMTEAVPAAILAGEPLPVAPLVLAPRRKGLRGLLGGGA